VGVIFVHVWFQLVLIKCMINLSVNLNCEKSVSSSFMHNLLMNETHDLNKYKKDRKYSSKHFTVDRQSLSSD